MPKFARLLPVTVLLAALPALGQAPARVRDQWDFRFKQFVIGAWWGPNATDAELQLYRDAGFNVVMAGRYMQLSDYGHPDKGIRELDLARKHGLAVMFDTYTKNEHPWGGKAGLTDAHPLHHPASLPELQWLYGRLGRHPALAGFMIGDDQGSVSQRAADCTRFLHEQGPPHLMPWLCGWISPDNLAQHGNPIEDPQIYPTLYSWQLPPQELARQYCLSYAGLSRKCRDLGILFWPMFNTTLETRDKPAADAFGWLPSDSLIRFPAYAAVAYGAQGIWYFTYGGGAIEHVGEYKTSAEARKALTPLYPVAREINRRIAPWGPELMRRTSTGLFGTAFGASRPEWPLGDTADRSRTGTALAPPAEGKLVERMDPDLLVGILTRPGANPMAMVVDCRASKSMGDLPVRTVTVRFTPAVRRAVLLEGGRRLATRGRDVTLTLEAGGGRMLALEGAGLGALCTPEAIYAAARPAPASGRTVGADDLAHIRAARLRIDASGSNAEPQYRAKYIELNGHRLATVPPSDGDTWTLCVVELTPEQLAWLKPQNEVVVRTECEDAWKFRNLCLAVQLADGTWVGTNTDPTVHSTPNWANTEGQPWGKDGVAGPVQLQFPRR